MPSTATSILDGLSTSVAVKAPVAATTSGNITLAGLQGYTEDDRILVWMQSTASENGIYAAATGSWTRTKDFDGNRDVRKGTLIPVEGSAILYRVTSSNPIIIGTSSIAFEALGPTQTQVDIGLLLYPRTAAEIAALVTPTDYSRQALPVADAARYGFAEGRTEAQNATSISAAISALLQTSAAGGIVQLPPGKFNVDPFLIPPNVWVRGAGLQATWLTNGDTGTFITMGTLTNTGVLKYGCGLSDLSVFCDHRNGNAIYMRECASAMLTNLYLENNGRTGNTDTCAAVTIDAGNVSTFFNQLTLVMANHWHYCFRILSTGSVIPTQTIFHGCTAFGDVSGDNGSIGLDIVASIGGDGQQSVWYGGNIESCAIGVKHGANTGSLKFFGLRTEANTVDVQFGLTCSAQTYVACLLDPAKITDNSGAGYERHTIVFGEVADGGQFGNLIPGPTILRAAASASEVPLKIKAFPSQTADLLQLLNSSDSLQFGITFDGALKRTVGISGTTTRSNNLRGSATFVAATTVAVTFATAESDASYEVFVGSQANKTFWVTSKATGGFTLNASSSSSDTVSWLLVR